MMKAFLPIALVAFMSVTAPAFSFWVSKPDGIEPVGNFDINKYLGTWYEIGRFDNRFERNLDNVTATYSLREDGGVKVDNKGYNRQQQKWENSIGKAYFVNENEQDKGFLKVSFFWIFYGGYVIFDLDENYTLSLVTSNDRDYFWILSRTPTISETEKNRILRVAKSNGFDTDKIIWVNQDKAEQ